MEKWLWNTHHNSNEYVHMALDVLVLILRVVVFYIIGASVVGNMSDENVSYKTDEWFQTLFRIVYVTTAYDTL